MRKGRTAPAARKEKCSDGDCPRGPGLSAPGPWQAGGLPVRWAGCLGAVIGLVAGLAVGFVAGNLSSLATERPPGGVSDDRGILWTIKVLVGMGAGAVLGAP